MTRRPQRGFTMIEILVALVVLAVGLLGIAGLQTVGLRHTHSSHLTTQANMLGNDMAERMRANMGGVNGGGYSAVTGNETDPGCGTNCTEAQRATLDGNQWGAAIAALLPGGNGSVTRNADGTFTVAINWTELDGDGPQTRNYAIRMRP